MVDLGAYGKCVAPSRENWKREEIVVGRLARLVPCLTTRKDKKTMYLLFRTGDFIGNNDFVGENVVEFFLQFLSVKDYNTCNTLVP